MACSKSLKNTAGLTSLQDVATNLADMTELAYERRHGLVNISALGTLTSPTPSARPPSHLLLGHSHPTPAEAWWSSCWSYYFSPDLPDITTLNLVITFPRPVHLTEVHLLCHGGPSVWPPNIEVEVGTDLANSTGGMIKAPVMPLVTVPMKDSPLESWITVRLSSPQSIRRVLLRIFKPQESSFVYIPRIKLLEPVGCGKILENTKIELLKTNKLINFIGFLEETEEFSVHDLYKRIFQSEAEITDVWNYCLYALTEPLRSEASMSRVAAILLHFDKHPHPHSQGGPTQEPLIQKLVGSSVASTLQSQPQLDVVTGLLYDLCCGDKGSVNIAAVVRWLEEYNDKAISTPDFHPQPAELRYMKALSSALWTLEVSLAETGRGNERDLEKVITTRILKKLYVWSIKLHPKRDSKLKSSVDYIICSTCYCRPWLFVYLMCYMDLIRTKDGNQFDAKGSSSIDLLEQWYNEENLWTNLKPNGNKSSGLTLSGLDTLATAARSSPTAKILKESSLIEHFNFQILEFCNAYGTNGEIVDQSNLLTLSALLQILKFYQNLCFLNKFRTFFGSIEGLDSWLPIFTLLSTISNDAKSSVFGNHLEEIESTMIHFLVSLSWNCVKNQKQIFPLLKKVISRENSAESTFTTNLLVSLLLETENVFVRVKSARKFSFKIPSPVDSIAVVEDFHPCTGVKGLDRVLDVKITSSASDILRLISEEGTFNLRLGTIPEFGIPESLTLQQLIALQGRHSKGRMLLLDMLELELGQETRQVQEDIFKIPAISSILDVFCEDGGLELIFQRLQVMPQSEPMVHTVIDSICRFLNLPCYSDVLQEEKFQHRTNYLIRLAMAKTQDQDREDTQLSPYSESLESLPFEVMNWLLDTQPPEAEVGQLLRGCMVHSGAFKFLLEFLDKIAAPEPGQTASVNDNTASNIWAKGTGFAVGSISTTGQDPVQKEEMMTCLLNVLSNFFGDTPALSSSPEVVILMSKSSLITIVSGYLINDSVLDIANHFPLYRVILQLLRSLAPVPQFRAMLVPREGEPAISAKLNKLKDVVDSYVKLVRASNAQDLDLAQLIQDIEATASRVEEAETEVLKKGEEERVELEEECDTAGDVSPITPKNLDEIYVEKMEKFRFEYYEMIVDGPFFKVPYHYQEQVQENWSQAGPRISSRGKRLIQEIVTLSKSLPISSSSSIFMRCDKDRLDVLKVLITGPAGTPYANGCFEFDIHFPLDYPQDPPMVHFETTARGKVRFNPNLHNDGNVCLSILGTWHGAPEEQWNPKTSSLLLVLVAIQSLILSEEPYWNEPLWQTLGGTEEGAKKAKEYKAYIRYYTLQYAILEQLRSPSSCFTEVIQRHFWMKKEEILKQCEEWEETTNVMDADARDSFKQTVTLLKSEISKMTRPEGLEDI